MAVDADTAASALATSWQHLVGAMPGWARREGRCAGRNDIGGQVTIRCWEDASALVGGLSIGTGQPIELIS